MNRKAANEDFNFMSNQEQGTAWVNGKHNCLGRFTKHGWEIYRDMGAPVEVIGTTSTIVVRVRETNEKDWKDFVLLLKEHHNVDISAEEYPSYVTGEKS